MGVSCTVSETNGDFSRKSQYFPTPVYFAPLLNGFPLELGIGARDIKIMNDLSTGLIKKFDDIFGRYTEITFRHIDVTRQITLAVWIQCTNVTDGHMDGRRATAKTALTHSVTR